LRLAGAVRIAAAVESSIASVSHELKRLLAAELRFGSADAHLARYAHGLAPD